MEVRVNVIRTMLNVVLAYVLPNGRLSLTIVP